MVSGGYMRCFRVIKGVFELYRKAIQGVVYGLYRLRSSGAILTKLRVIDEV